ncbi:actin, gamma-enteric smooth muscle [Dasypus novemcinctus]|uniref:actin, gamma-enteric smooth muscle n=1 Tax=Dasypus novemcinctus TaxID=9361 RepID=UPI00265E08A7|nr:actin [Dasypus novemcinctus]
MENSPLVCDYGSGFSKVGYAGMDAPQTVFPTVLGKLRHDRMLVGMEEKDWFIGAEVQSNREKLNLQYPISRSKITNWEDMEKIWHHAFYQVLRVAPEQHPLLVTEPPLTATSSKERVSQVMFETFNVPALYLANQGVLSLYSSGRTSGTAIESGEGATYFVPVIEGCPLHQSILQMDVAGQDLTLYLLQLLAESGHSFTTVGDWEHVRYLKETCCHVALDYHKEKEEAEAPSYEQRFQLPDGQEVTLGKERFLCPEALFQTELLGKSSGREHLATGRMPAGHRRLGGREASGRFHLS